jgi:hypothetical protein
MARQHHADRHVVEVSTYLAKWRVRLRLDYSSLLSDHWETKTPQRTLGEVA